MMSSRFFGGGVLAVGLVVGVVACSSDDQPAASPSDVEGTNVDASTDAALDSAAESTCKVTFTTADGGVEPWAGVEPQDGASCEGLGAWWSDGCCRKICQCTATGWSCTSPMCK